MAKPVKLRMQGMKICLQWVFCSLCQVSLRYVNVNVKVVFRN